MVVEVGEFLVFVVLLVAIPGPDFAVVAKNALTGGRRGSWTSAGVAESNFVQWTAAARGLSALIVRTQPLSETAGGRPTDGVESVREAVYLSAEGGRLPALG